MPVFCSVRYTIIVSKSLTDIKFSLGMGDLVAVDGKEMQAGPT